MQILQWKHSHGRFWLNLTWFDCPMPDAERFCRIFQSVFVQGLQPLARDKIADQWRKHVPCIYLIADPRAWKGTGWAATTESGTRLWFLSTMLRDIPEPYLAATIAHELGHILCTALGEKNHCKGGSVEIQELIVYEIMDRWGFDQAGTENWIEQNFDVICPGLPRRPAVLSAAELTFIYSKKRTAQRSMVIDYVFPDELLPFAPQPKLGVTSPPQLQLACK